MGYVSYSPSIYYKKLKFYIEQNKIKFDKIFLFIDHSDIQDEGIFYREDKKGNIVRKWYSDDKVSDKKRKHYYKNYFKQNSFIYKLYENLNSPKISYKSKKCILDSSEKNYNDYLEIERFGYGYNENILKKEWVFVGIKKINNYLDKILNLSKKYDFKIYLVYYPSALEVLNKINFNSSKHFIFLENWSKKNNITFINSYHAFNKSSDKTKNYLTNFIECDVHWNKKGHEIISNSLINYINE